MVASCMVGPTEHAHPNPKSPGHKGHNRPVISLFHAVKSPPVPLRNFASVCKPVRLFSRLESRSLSVLTRQITPQKKICHALPPTQSRISSQSVNPSCDRAGLVFPCSVKLSRDFHPWSCFSINFFKFQLCKHTSTTV